VLTGDNGVGKSTLAAAAVNRRLQNAGVLWVSVASLVAQSFGDDQAKAKVAAALTGRSAIVLDDIDKVKAGEWVSSQLFAAIDNRVSRGAGLIVTTNLPVNRLAAKFEGEFATAIGSRLAGYCAIHTMVGPDRRLG
jgi:DNA replication protein DnaC